MQLDPLPHSLFSMFYRPALYSLSVSRQAHSASIGLSAQFRKTYPRAIELNRAYGFRMVFCVLR